ncbi:MAG: hypothetical protein HY699_21040 [Deltaproteobacteria bacterium]|nr:hypothetical protein [Deltaproteobacteria bacterium]
MGLLSGERPWTKLYLADLFEAKWTKLPAASGGVKLDFVRWVAGKSRIAAAIVGRARHGFPLALDLRATPVAEME